MLRSISFFYDPDIFTPKPLMFMKTKTVAFIKSIYFLFLLCLISLRSSAQSGYDKIRLSAFYQRQEYDEAINYLQSVENMNQQSASFNTDLAYSFYMNERYEEAKKYFQKRNVQ